jgi:hypothetical protein
MPMIDRNQIPLSEMPREMLLANYCSALMLHLHHICKLLFVDTLSWHLQGANNRKVAQTNMNHESSRSHSVFTCTVEGKVRP